MSEPLSVPVSAPNLQLPVGLSAEIISLPQIEQEFVWPKNVSRSQWQSQRTFRHSDDAWNRRVDIPPHFDRDTFMARTKGLDQSSRTIELLNQNAFQFTKEIPRMRPVTADGHCSLPKMYPDRNPDPRILCNQQSDTN